MVPPLRHIFSCVPWHHWVLRPFITRLPQPRQVLCRLIRPDCVSHDLPKLQRGQAGSSPRVEVWDLSFIIFIAIIILFFLQITWKYCCIHSAKELLHLSKSQLLRTDPFPKSVIEQPPWQLWRDSIQSILSFNYGVQQHFWEMHLRSV